MKRREDPKFKKRRSKSDVYDMYAVKEKPFETAKRIAGERYEKDLSPLKLRIAYLASDNPVKTFGMVSAMQACGLSFKLIGKHDFDVVVSR
jgi:hypothetical protein